MFGECSIICIAFILDKKETEFDSFRKAFLKKLACCYTNSLKSILEGEDLERFNNYMELEEKEKISSSEKNLEACRTKRTVKDVVVIEQTFVNTQQK
eukprot:gene537-8049_t